MRATNPFDGAVKDSPGVHDSSSTSPTGPPHTASEVAAAATLAATLALAAAAVVFGALLLIASHSETLEAIWWLAGFGVVAPLAVLGAGRLLSAADTPAARRALTGAAPCAVLALCAALALARAVGSLPASLFFAAAPFALLPALGRRRLDALAGHRNARALATAALAAAGALGIAAFLPSASHGSDVIVLTLLLLAVALPVVFALRRRALHPRARLALGVLIPLLLALLAWDVSFQVLTSHQDFYLGPANDIRHGRYMLVEDYSQYGVAVIYFLAAILAPLPFGYGTFVLVLGILNSVLILAVYVVLRVATRSLAFAAIGTFAALMSSSIATIGRSGQYPSTGFLRFGIPWLLVCALAVAFRRDWPERAPLVVAYLLVGVAAVWSFETAFYTVATFAVSVIAAALTRPDGRRLRCAAAHLGAGAAAAIAAIALLVTATEIGRGRLPQIGGYLDFLRLYSVAGFGQLPVPGWSLGYLMGALCVASLTATFLMAVRGRGSKLGRPSTIVPLAALGAFAAVALTYFLGRSHPNNLTHVAPPFVAMVTLWTALAWRAWARERNPVAVAGVALAGVCAALLIAQQLPQLVDKAPDSALVAGVHTATGGRGLAQRVRALTDLPVINPRTRTVEALVRRSVPGEAPLLVAVEPAVATETLIRLDRSDILPIGTPEQDGLPLARRRTLLRAARDVRCRTYVVTQDARMTGPGSILLRSLVTELRHRHPFRAVSRAGGYRVFRLGCGPA
ncbi:MAG: hypothetical protein M3Q31_20140 [Actinomycetota bacterium]|nr:hypothetical protein [Actinomycetota bacterium]